MNKIFLILILIIKLSINSFTKCEVCDYTYDTGDVLPTYIGGYYNQNETHCVLSDVTTGGMLMGWTNTIEVCDGTILTITGSVQNGSGNILINGNSEVHINGQYNDYGGYFGGSVDVSAPDCSESFFHHLQLIKIKMIK